MKKSLLQSAALISTLLLTSCAGSNTTTNTSAQNDESIQNTVAVQNVETAQNTEAVQAPIPDDDYFIQNARNFVAEQTELPNAESFIDAANKDDGDAAFILSMMYRMNIGGVEHIKKGKISKGNVSLADEVHRWTIIGLEREHLLADYAHDHSLEINHEQFSNGEYEKSRQWLELAAKNGLSDAEFVLGIVYYNGIGQPKDEAKGQELIARAAIHGLPIAQYYVGMFYELGMGTSVNKSKAMEWLVKAADAKNPDAEFILALKYFDGIDVDKNSEKAEAYRSSHENYHAWNLLMNKKHRGDFELICKSDYDLVSMGSEYDDECGGDADYYDPNLSERENERRRMEYAAQERANASLLYAIDYRIAWNWLDKVASDVTHINARLLRTQVCGLSGCKCGDELEYGARVKAVNDELEAIYHQNESSSVVQYALGSYYHHVIVRDNDDGEHEDITKQYAKKAFDLYISADKAGYERASVALGDMYYFIDEPRLGSFLDIDVNNKLAFEYYHRGNESDRAGTIAFQGGELARTCKVFCVNSVVND